MFRPAALASLNAVVAALVIVLACQAPDSTTPATSSTGLSPTPDAPPPATATVTNELRNPFDDLIVDIGDSVAASGNVIDWGRSTTSPILCTDLLFIGYQPGCPSGASIAVLGVDAHSLPGSDAAGTWVTSYLTLRGAWAENGIDVSDAVISSEPETSPPPVVPCASPTEGWPGNGSALDNEAAWIRLKNRVDAEPDLYVGLWNAVFRPADGFGSEGAQVVGTVGDVSVESERLEQTYPFNLCVVGVTFSASDLDAAAQAIDAATGASGIEVVIDPALDRLVVHTLALDRATAEALSAYGDRVIVRPIVKPAR